MQVFYHKQFKKDIKNCIKAGKDTNKIKLVIKKLMNEEPLNPRYKLHRLTGNYKDRYECHIEPDWLLIFKQNENELFFERTGSHSKLFK